MTDRIVHVLGAGLAGSAAAHAAAAAGVPVRLYEMRPDRMTPAHRTGLPAELVCSNSLGGEGRTQAKGLLQAEMRAAGCLILEAAEEARVPAGGALAVDREVFSRKVEEGLRALPSIERIGCECEDLPAEGPVVLATGPLTGDSLAGRLRERLGEAFLRFHDAAAPVVLGESLDREVVFAGGRWGKGEDYLNCPLEEESYRRLHDLLERGRRHAPHDWEDLSFFEGCMPIEELARRGFDTPRFGPLRPRGLVDPRTGREPFAVVQLRREDKEGRMWSLVGFQTGLKWGDQKECVRAIPGLERAEIVRYGVMHRNTYLNAPRLCDEALRLRVDPRVHVAGVLAGVEGYLESAATGWLAGRNAARRLRDLEPALPPPESMLGGLLRFLRQADPEGFQPMNANWGLVPPAGVSGPKRIRREAMFTRGLATFRAWLESSRP